MPQLVFFATIFQQISRRNQETRGHREGDIIMNQPAVASRTMESSEAPFNALLVAYDASEASETALQYAIAVAHGFGSVVTVASVLPPSDLAIEMEGGFGRWQAHQQMIEDLQQVGTHSLAASRSIRRIDFNLSANGCGTCLPNPNACGLSST